MSDKPSHPPIPPNCEYFKETRHGYLFQIQTAHHIAVYVVDAYADLHWSGLIAAVAEVAWIREAEKHDRALKRSYFAWECNDEEDRRHIEAEQTALRNREAWRDWGKGEWKP